MKYGKITGKVLLLSAVMFAAFIAGSQLAGLPEETAQNAQFAVQKAFVLFMVCILNSAVLAYPILRSRWTGWRLAAGVFIVYFGVSTFLSQLESLVFLKAIGILSLETIARITLEGLITAGLVSPLAVLILGRFKKEPEDAEQKEAKLNFTWPQWAGKIALIGVVYILLYFMFGYIIAWQSPAVRLYYAKLKLPQWILFFQFARAVIWTLLAVTVVKMMKGRRWEVALAAGLLFSFLMGLVLLVPGNPIMPDEVRMAHFWEITFSNFIFGWLAVGIIQKTGPGRKGNPAAGSR